MTNTFQRWSELGTPAPRSLVEARFQAHYAIQIASAVGRAFVPARKDDSHTSLRWLPLLGAFASELAPGETPFRAALDFDNFRVLLLDDENHFLSAQPLGGLRLGDGYAWLKGAISDHTGQAVEQDLSAAHYTLPGHALAAGDAFSDGHLPAIRELGRWYSNAQLLLEAVRKERPSASEIRCWPHHFDLASLIDLGGGKSIGVGLSPGDESYAEPYLYVSPWPYPAPGEWPELPSGRWHAEGFTAAVLTATQIVAAEDQAGLASGFLRSAVGAAGDLLGEG